MATDALSAEDKEFLAKCEEELKDRFTEKDEDFLKVYNELPSTPPVLDPWWVPNSGRRNERRGNRRNHPYQRDNRDRNYEQRDNRDRNYEQRDNRDRNYERRDNRGYSDYNKGYDDSSSGYRPRHRYQY